MKTLIDTRPQNIWFVGHEMGCMVDFYKDTGVPKDQLLHIVTLLMIKVARAAPAYADGAR